MEGKHNAIKTDEGLVTDERSGGPAAGTNRKKWKIIIADDEQEVHAITRMVLDDYTFEGQKLDFLSAYTGKETLRLVREHPDTAVILLDVVMEADDSGLVAARDIRKELKNRFVRIVLRTGQPGRAPEKEVITEYDINDYKEKTELTAQKLFTTITSSLRAYRDLRAIDRNRKGLEKIIDSSAHLFEIQSYRKFAEGMLIQLLSILSLDDGSWLPDGGAFTAMEGQDGFVILAARGKFREAVGKSVQEVIHGHDLDNLVLEEKAGKHFIDGNAFVGYFSTSGGARHLLYLDARKRLSEIDRDLILIFSTNVAIALENISLTKEIVDTQKEVVYTLGEVIENRSSETGNHVRRVSEFSYLLALKAGLSEKEAELLRLASPMHDVGKVGIPDAILSKPGELTKKEFENIMRHPTIGYEILRKSSRGIMEAAVIVARQHHERWDGTGYPRGLKGENIHIYGRITALTDVFDALIHKRIYKDAWDPQRVVAHIREQRGKIFEPRLVDLFLENLNAFLEISRMYPDDEPFKPQHPFLPVTA